MTVSLASGVALPVNYTVTIFSTAANRGSPRQKTFRHSVVHVTRNSGHTLKAVYGIEEKARKIFSPIGARNVGVS